MTPEQNPFAATGLRWFGLSDRGKVRKNNEDSFLGLQFDARESWLLGKIGEATMEHHDYVFAVSDGMGGAMAGEFASRIAVEKIQRLLPRAYRQSASGLDAGFGDVLEQLYDEVHKALTFVGSSYEETKGMGATLTLSWFTPGWAYFAHIGDSRLYYLPARERGIRRVTHDDTYVDWMFRQGQLNEREAREHPRRNVLQKALGAGHQFVDPQVGSIGCERGDLFVLCSDGIVDGLYDYQILDLLRPAPGAPPEPGETLAQRLILAALERSGRDNTTALVIEAV